MLFKSPVSTQQCLEQMSAAMEQADLFFGHGTDNAWDESCWLLETLLRRSGVGNITAELMLEQPFLQQLALLLERRVTERVPVAYLLNEAWFCGLPFYVDERVLIPRSPFAELIDNGFAPYLDTSPRHILDLCTGSGCIGIAAAMAFPDARVDLADLSGEALEVAQKNIDKYKLNHRVKLIHSDVFGQVTKRYDLILSNPPYVSDVEYQELPQEYFQEPELGLVSNNEGLELPLRIIAEAADYLTDRGILFLETGYTWPMLDAALPNMEFTWLDFELGGEGVCMLSRAWLMKAGSP